MLNESAVLFQRCESYLRWYAVQRHTGKYTNFFFFLLSFVLILVSGIWLRI